MSMQEQLESINKRLARIECALTGDMKSDELGIKPKVDILWGERRTMLNWFRAAVGALFVAGGAWLWSKFVD